MLILIALTVSCLPHISPSLHFHCTRAAVARYNGFFPRADPANLSSPPFPPPPSPFSSPSPPPRALVQSHQPRIPKLVPKCFPPTALCPTTGAQPLSEGGGEVPCRAECPYQSAAQLHSVGKHEEQCSAGPSGWLAAASSRCAPLHSLPSLSSSNQPTLSSD